MTDIQVLLLFAGMMLVTYIPRALPLVFKGKLKFGKKTEKFLRLIPFTAMAALIFPGVFEVGGSPLFGLTGVAAAGILAWLKLPVMVCVLGAVGIDLVLLLIL